MVYGKYRRTAVYQLRNMMKTRIIIRNKCQDIEFELNVATKTLHSLPHQHWLELGFLNGTQRPKNVEVYYLLLHKRDVCVSVPSPFRGLSTSGIYFVDLDETQLRKLDQNNWYGVLDDATNKYAYSRDSLWISKVVEIFSSCYEK